MGNLFSILTSQFGVFISPSENRDVILVLLQQDYVNISVCEMFEDSLEEAVPLAAAAFLWDEAGADMAGTPHYTRATL